MLENILHKIGAGILASLLLTACGSSGFDPQGLLESRPVRLDGEQVTLDPGQIDCGVREELWAVTSLGDARSVARLTPKGRELQFSDDVHMGEVAVSAPYVQLSGSFPVKVLRVGSVRDQDEFTKLADAKIGVQINHACFGSPLPILMGIKHGQFDPSTNPVFRFKLDGEWSTDQVVH